MANATLPPGFDPYAQNFTLLAPDGTRFTTNMAELDYLRLWTTEIAINWATQIGASVILLLVLLLLTRREKRRSSIFIMNVMCLVLNAIRSILQCVYLTTSYLNPYATMSGDYSRVTAADQANTIASNTILLLLIICIMISLSLQVWTVCITTKPLGRWIIMGTTTVMALIAIGFRFAVVVISNIYTLQNRGMGKNNNLVTNMQITQAIAVWLYCLAFTFKLGHALIQRRRLRLTQFGPMQIIFIMGLQTMIIPAIFTSLQFYDNVPELGSQGTTIICIFMPLSAIWAGLVANDASIGARGADSHQRLLKDQFYPSPRTTSTGSPGEKTSILACSTCTSGKEPDGLMSHGSSQRVGCSNGNSIYVDRNWAVVADDAGDASDKV